MRLRRWEALIIGTDKGEPYADSLGRTFTRWGANERINRALFSGPALIALGAAKAIGWQLETHGVVRRLGAEECPDVVSGPASDTRSDGELGGPPVGAAFAPASAPSFARATILIWLVCMFVNGFCIGLLVGMWTL